MSVTKRTLAAAMVIASCSYNPNNLYASADSNAAASAALKALKNMDYRYFVAGGTCAAFSHGITTPIDVVKTKLQANPQVSRSSVSSGRSCMFPFYRPPKFVVCK